MTVMRELVTRFFVGSLLSAIFVMMLKNRLIEEGAGDTLALSEFLVSTENVLFFCHMLSLILASWLIRGNNNQTVLVFYAIGSVIGYKLSFWGFEYFYYQNINVYVLNFLGLLSLLPLFLLIRFRLIFSAFIAHHSGYIPLLGKQVGSWFAQARGTDFSFVVLYSVKVGLVLEFLYAIYMTGYALAHNIPPEVSISLHMFQFAAYDPNALYHSLHNLITLIIIAIILWNIYTELKIPDRFGFGATTSEKQNIAKAIIARKKREKKAKSS